MINTTFLLYHKTPLPAAQKSLNTLQISTFLLYHASTYYGRKIILYLLILKE